MSHSTPKRYRPTYQRPALGQSTRFVVDWRSVGGAALACLAVVILVVWAFHLGSAMPTPASAPGASVTEAVSPPPAPAPDVEPSHPGTDAAPDWAPEGMPPCVTEDSMGCYWDAGARGDGRGCSFVAQDGFVIYTEGEGCQVSHPGTAPAEPAQPEPAAEAEEEPAPGTEESSTNEPVQWHAMDEGMLVCGPDAKPALDFDSSGMGWWAYCEPALVD